MLGKPILLTIAASAFLAAGYPPSSALMAPHEQLWDYSASSALDPGHMLSLAGLVFAALGVVALLETRLRALEKRLGVLMQKRNEAERLRMENEEYLRRIMATLQVGIAMIDAETHEILDINPKTEELVGLPREKIVGQVCHSFICPAEKGACPISDLRQTIDRSSRVLLDKNGNTIPILKSVVPMVYMGRKVLIESFVDMSGHREMLDSLRDSERKFRLLFEAHSAVMLMVDPDDGKILDANPAACRFYGYSSREMKGLSITQINTFTPDEMRQTILSILNQGNNHFQFKHRLKSGAIRDVEVHSVPIPVGGKTIIYSIIHDATAKRRAEEALKRTHREMEVLFENSRVGIILLRGDRTFVKGNQRFAEIFGYTHINEIIGKNSRIIHLDEESYRDFGTRHYQKLLAGLPARVEYRLRKKDGAPVWCVLSGKALDPAMPPDLSRGVLWCIDDISEQKAAEEALRESEERFRTMTDAAKDAIMMMDQEGKVTFWNKSAETVFGYSREEALGCDLLSLVAPGEFRDKAREGMPAFAQTGHGTALGKTLELIALRKEGSCFPVEVSLSAVQMREGLHVIGLARDITDRKEFEARLIETNRELEEATRLANEMAAKAGHANQAKSAFLATMSHEIRTPLNGIIGMNGLLLETPLSPEQEKYCHAVQASAESLLSIINEILDFSKIEAGKVDIEAIDFDLQSVLDEIGETLSVAPQKKGLEYICQMDPDVPSALVGDPGRLRQVLVNLVGNAVKFTDKGEIVVRVSMQNNGPSHVTLQFTVSDTGIGIAEERIQSLFEPFVQADSSTTRKYGGTGLGLAISIDLVHLMGGSMGVKSRPEEGSTFWFNLIFEKQRSAGEEGEGEGAALALLGKRVLVVDDNETNRLLARIHLEHWGCFPEEAADGQAALGALFAALERGTPFDIIVCDMQMPVMDGAGLARAARRHPELGRLPIILMSSIGLAADENDAALFDSRLDKPVRPARLKETLVRALSGASALRESAPAPPVSLNASRRLRILVAEDHPTNQQVALAILRKMGHHADAVGNGIEAVEVLCRVRYDMVLMDVHMPEMDGIEASRTIRDAGSPVLDHGIPIIAMTALAMQGDKERCLDAGMDDYVTKPVRKEALFAAIERNSPLVGTVSEPEEEVGEEKSMAARGPESPAQGAGRVEQKLESGLRVFNKEELMSTLDNDEEVLEAVIGDYLGQTRGQIEGLERALEQGDAKHAMLLAHAVKGASATVSAERAAEYAMRTERAAREEDLEGACVSARALVVAFQEFEACWSGEGRREAGKMAG
jgi:PAS domain S-box-containing protein